MALTEHDQQIINDIVWRIDQLRIELGYSINKLAQEAGISANTVKYIYKRKSFPSLSTLSSLCDVFHLSLWQFFLFQETIARFTKKEFDLLEKFEKLSPHSRELLFELTKCMK